MMFLVFIVFNPGRFKKIFQCSLFCCSLNSKKAKAAPPTNLPFGGYAAFL